MYKQIITLIPDKDYNVWCNGEFVVLRHSLNNKLLFYKNTSDVKKEFKVTEDQLTGISLIGGKNENTSQIASNKKPVDN